MSESSTVAATPEVVSAEEWQRRRDELLVAEKAATREEDRLAARRRRLPMVEFGEHSQLALYQFMDVGPDGLCPGCTYFTSNVVNLAELAARDIAWATVSDMPVEQIERVKADKGWTVPFYSSRGTSFSADCGAGEGFMLTMFLRDGDRVFRTYNTTQRGVDRLLFANNIPDLAVYGRQEDWEDSPSGWPQHPTYG